MAGFSRALRLAISIWVIMGAFGGGEAFARKVDADTLADVCVRNGGIMIVVTEGEYYCYLPDGRLVMCVTDDCWIIHPTRGAFPPSVATPDRFVKATFGQTRILAKAQLRHAAPGVTLPGTPRFSPRQIALYRRQLSRYSTLPIGGSVGGVVGGLSVQRDVQD